MNNQTLIDIKYKNKYSKYKYKYLQLKGGWIDKIATHVYNYTVTTATEIGHLINILINLNFYDLTYNDFAALKSGLKSETLKSYVKDAIKKEINRKHIPLIFEILEKYKINNNYDYDLKQIHKLLLDSLKSVLIESNNNMNMVNEIIKKNTSKIETGLINIKENINKNVKNIEMIIKFLSGFTNDDMIIIHRLIIILDEIKHNK
jgi:hypothetical protein